MPNPFKSYQESTLHSSSAADIFIQCYDEVIRLLYSAARAIEAGDIEKKTCNLNRALAFVVHLQVALDLARGGDIALQLNHFYVLVRQQVFQGSVQLKPDLLRQCAAYFFEVRKIWEEARTIPSEIQPTNPPLPPQDAPFRAPQNIAPATPYDGAETHSPSDWSA